MISTICRRRQTSPPSRSPATGRRKQIIHGLHSPTIAPSGTTFAQFQAGGASGILERLIAANFLGTAAPATPTLSATGGGTTGGSLAAGTYYVKVTETNGIGETTASPEASVTIAAGNIPQVTFAALQAGNTARNVYVGAASGAEVLYASGITAAPQPLGRDPDQLVCGPRAHDQHHGADQHERRHRGVGNQKLAALRACEKGRLQRVWDNLARLIAQFNRGEPVSFNNLTAKLRDAHTVFAMSTQLCAEMGTLIDANPGHFTNVPTGIGGQKTVRQWP